MTGPEQTVLFSAAVPTRLLSVSVCAPAAIVTTGRAEARFASVSAVPPGSAPAESEIELSTPDVAVILPAMIACFRQPLGQYVSGEHCQDAESPSATLPAGTSLSANACPKANGCRLPVKPCARLNVANSSPDGAAGTTLPTMLEAEDAPAADEKAPTCDPPVGGVR
jgi:hypothetical protein